jgi:hypothetical protein
MRPRRRRALAGIRPIGGGRPAGHDGIRQRQPAGAGEHVRVPAVRGHTVSRRGLRRVRVPFDGARRVGRSTVPGGGRGCMLSLFVVWGCCGRCLPRLSGLRRGLLALFPERRAEQIELADGCARAADGRSLAFAQLAADGLRVTTAFGNDNRLRPFDGARRVGGVRGGECPARQDPLRVTTAFGNDNRLTYTYGSAAAHAAAANYRRRASALCASAASANLCLVNRPTCSL